jgi:heme oxygenase
MTDVVDTVITPEELAYRAYQMRVKGYSWAHIAEEYGYTGPMDAHRKVTYLIKAAGAALSDERKEEILDLELARLDELQRAYYQSGIDGDLKAAEFVLKVMNHRAKLARLGEEQVQTTQTVIVTDSNYLSALQGLAE